MRKIVANFFMTLDGVVESPGEWSLQYWNDDIQQVVGGAMSSSDAMLLGRVTYQEFEASWSGRTVQDDAGAEHMNSTRKYVASTTLTETNWSNSTLLTGDLGGAVTALKNEDGGDIIISGSATLVRALLDQGLVDELNLLVYPVVRGSGARLFTDNSPPLTLRLTSSTAFSNGVLNLVYQPTGQPDS